MTAAKAPSAAYPVRYKSSSSTTANNGVAVQGGEFDDLYDDDLLWLDECLSGDFMDFITEDDFAMLANEKGKW